MVHNCTSRRCCIVTDRMLLLSRHQADEATAQEEAAKVGAIKAECEADLAQALPAFSAAIKVRFGGLTNEPMELDLRLLRGLSGSQEHACNPSLPVLSLPHRLSTP